MKSSNLNGLLIGLDTGKELQQVIQEEVTSYCDLMKKKGAGIFLYFSEDQNILITLPGFKRLLLATLDGYLSAFSLSYICDCLTLGEQVSYENEDLLEIVHEIADPEINGGFQKMEDIRFLIKRLN